MAAIRFDRVTKRFPGVVALDGVSFDVLPGEIHAICGENGAGKSTLGRLLAGIDTPDSGSILLDGAPVAFTEPRDALQAGVGLVHQELAFCDNLTVADNLCLGALPARWAFVSSARLAEQARERLSAVGAGHIDPASPVSSLGIAGQQMVQIAAAVAAGARVIVFDEPTSSLGQQEAERLFALMGQLRARGITQLYVSHRMSEIFRLADRITVLRDGHHVITYAKEHLDENTLVQHMIGRRVEQYFAVHATKPAGDEALGVEHLMSPGRFTDISFSVRQGEVLGLAGLVGAGRSELARALFGLDPNASGQVRVRGHAVTIRSPRDAMSLGIGLVPEDRKRQGLVLSMAARENVTLPTIDRFSKGGMVRRRQERALALELLDRLRVRRSVMDALAVELSGGNQQKLVLAKWLGAKSTILILDEPTRGVDVGAKAELHGWIGDLAQAGAAIVLISSELPELLNLSTRVLVLREGRIAGELTRDEATPDRVLRLMAGLESRVA